MPLNIIIVGAGIGGLCAAVALRQAGHNVIVLEKSRFVGEVGAALLVTPNGSRVLRDLEFSFSNARGNLMTRWEVLDGLSLAALTSTELGDAEERYGASLFTMHRADLHNELMRLATRTVTGQRAVKLQVDCTAKSTDPNTGAVELEDGTVLHADLVVGADGLHSVTKAAVLQDQTHLPMPSGMSAFRFQIPTSMLENDAHFQELLKSKGKGSTVLVDTKELSTERHLVWYDCKGGEIQNFVGIHQEADTKTNQDLKAMMLQEFGHFHPSIVHIISVTPEVGDWPMPLFDPLPHWSRGKVVLIGDAAHPMLPFGGQGANQAIEDAGALGALLKDIGAPQEISERLRMFETVRRLRAARVQTLSKVRLGKEKDIESELQKYADPPGSDVPTTFEQRYEHDFT